MATKEISIKLMVDTKSNKLVFAEGSNDFVDLLFFLLSLPIATVIKLLTSESMVGSIANLYTSFANLTELHLLPTILKDVHLNPMIVTSATNIPMLIAPSSSIMSFKFYKCTKPNCGNRVNTATINSCGYCKQCSMALQEVSVVINGCDVVTTVTPRNDPKGYVKAGTPYMIYDDLTVKPMSTMLIISMMNKFGVLNIHLKEMEVKIGAKEMLEVLKGSFQSTTVLTDVFLRTGKKIS